MKKHVLILLAICAVKAGYSQTETGKMNYQLNFGTTLTVPYKKTIEISPNINNNPQTDYNSNFGYFLEFLVSYNFNNKYAISTGLNYNNNTLKIDDKIAYTENKGTLTSSYLNLPILFRYRFSDKIPLSISAGPYFGLLIGATEKGTTYIDTAEFVFITPNDPVIESIEPIHKYDNDIKKDYTKIDFGLLVELNYELKLCKRLTGVILTRFNYGIKNVLTDDLANKNIASKWQNYNLIIGFGIKI